MVHPFHAAAAPRVYLIPIFPLLALAGAGTLLFTGNVAIGLVVLAIGAWLSYYMIRYTIYQFRSKVETDSQGITCTTSMGFDTGMSWSDVTHSGSYTTERGAYHLFVYDESADELLTIPSHYRDIDQLERTIRKRTGGFLELAGRSPDDLADTLKPYLPGSNLHSDSSD